MVFLYNISDISDIYVCIIYATFTVPFVLKASSKSINTNTKDLLYSCNFWMRNFTVIFRSIRLEICLLSLFLSQPYSSPCCLCHLFLCVRIISILCQFFRTKLLCRPRLKSTFTSSMTSPSTLGTLLFFISFMEYLFAYCDFRDLYRFLV